jgi:hypothetical protein
MNLAVLESVPPLHRPFAIAFSTLLMHLFGKARAALRREREKERVRTVALRRRLKL